MATHEFEPTRFHGTFGRRAPVLTVADGDTIRTWTVDAAGRNADGHALADGANPLTGPFHVDGAEPGDRLRVRILEVTPNRSYGFGRASLARNVVDPEAVADLEHEPANDGAAWHVDPVAGTATLTRPHGPLAGLTLPWAPMLGCLGVAPADGEAVSSATSGRHGGNMDVRRLGPGAVATFPVFVPGAALFFGDAHALQGDGEISGTGIEISADVRVTVEVQKGRPPIVWPRGEDAEGRFTMGNARPLDQATQHATTEMLRWLREETGLGPAEAGLFLSQTARYEIGNVFDPAYTMVCRVPHDAWALLPRGGTA